MNKDFVPYEEALAMKELGFNEPCITWYFDTRVDIKLYPESQPGSGLSLKGFKNSHKKIGITDCTAPLYQQAFRWFREKYNLFGCIDLHVCSPSHWFIRIDKIDINDYLYHSEDENIQYNTYEEAELVCLKKLIEIVKDDE